MMYHIAKEGKDYLVVESDTELVMIRTPSESKAKLTLDNLKCGCGFQGSTPPFFAIR